MKQILFFITVLFIFTVNAQQDNILCELRDFLALESKVDSTLKCKDAIDIKNILTNKCDLSEDFGVYSFSSTLIADGFIYYLVKHKNNYSVFSAKDPMLVTNKLLELQEEFSDEINLELVVKYIKRIGKTRASNMTTYMVVVRKINTLEYIYALGRYK